ncbi:hypothetical protein GGI07_005424 [Coemansia sp. Benny D115]|nr:hypothetical protein GGI07_005424 [Coemansia sp. Benny D115]
MGLSGYRRAWLKARLVFAMTPSDSDMPYLATVARRLAALAPGVAGVLSGARLCAFVGALLVILPSIASAVIEKQVLADAFQFEYPHFVHILQLLLASVAIEAMTGRYAVFMRTRAPRTLDVVVLALLYCAAALTGRWARDAGSVHGTYQALQALMPLAVVAVLGTTSQSPIWGRLTGRDTAGLASSLSHSTIDACGVHTVANKTRTAKSEWQRNMSRKLVVPMCLGLAVALWTPTFSITAANSTTSSAGAVQGFLRGIRSVLGTLMAVASLALNACFLVASRRFMDRNPALSPAGLLRHLLPLCALGMLVFWPVVESPSEMIKDVATLFEKQQGGGWQGCVAACVGVGVLGAVSLVSRVAMLGSLVADGPVGVAVLGLFRPLACVAVGWWAYGYRFWWVQVAGFVLACVSGLGWAAVRLFFSSAAGGLLGGDAQSYRRWREERKQ